MNKFKEFDYIQTPNDWKHEMLSQPHKTKVFYMNKLVITGLIMILCFSSFTVIYAYNEEFRSWIYQQFQIKSVEPIYKIDKQCTFINSFLYYYHESNNEQVIDNIFVLQNGKYIEQEIKHMEGVYQNQNYSFDYVRYQNQILTFNEKGYIVYSLMYLNGDIMYFGSSDTNLCSLNLKNQDVKKLTKDNDSVNFAISPETTYILINKTDKYWTVYNTKTHQERALKDLPAYAHSNEFSFLDDKKLITFNNNNKTCIIDLTTLKSTNLNVECIYPSASTFTLEFDENKTIINDIYQNRKQTIDINFKTYDYAVFKNRYIVFSSFDNKKIVIVDFNENKVKELDYLGTEEYIECFITEDNYLIITNTQDYYIISLNEISYK